VNNSRVLAVWCLILGACDGGSVVSDGGADLSADLSVGADLATTDLAGQCTDEDGDGRSAVVGCGELDCDDHDPNVWTHCGTCVDTDGDKHFAGCDGYITVRPDCDDGNPAITSHPEILGDGIDQDCDGIDTPTGDDVRILYVSASTGSDTNPGTKAKPVQTLDQAIMLATASKVGEVVVKHFLFLAAGSYTNGNIGGILPLRVSLYGGFDPATWTPTGGETTVGGETLKLYSADDGNTLQKLTCAGLSNSPIQAGGAATLVDCKVTAAAGGAGLTFSTGILSNAADLTVIRSSVTSGPGAYVDGINAGGGNLRIIDSTVTTHADGTSTGGRSHAVNFSGNTTFTATITGSTITAADAHGVTAIDIHGTTGQPMPYVVLTNNTISADAGISGAASSVAGVSGYGEAHTAVGNRITVNAGGNARGYALFTHTRSTLVNNYILVTGSGAGDNGILVYGSPADLINNTVRTPDGATNYAVEIDGAGSRLYNNLLVAGVSTGTAARIVTPDATLSITLENNALFGSTCLLATNSGCAASVDGCAWTGCLAASSTVAGDCGIGATDFHITTASACKSTGTNPSAVYAASFSDLDGVIRPQGNWDIGADEIVN